MFLTSKWNKWQPKPKRWVPLCMMEMESKKRYALALSFVSMQLSKVLDDIGEMLIIRMMSIHKKDILGLKEHKDKTQKRSDSLISTLHELLLAYKTRESCRKNSGYARGTSSTRNSSVTGLRKPFSC